MEELLAVCLLAEECPQLFCHFNNFQPVRASLVSRRRVKALLRYTARIGLSHHRLGFRRFSEEWAVALLERLEHLTPPALGSVNVLLRHVNRLENLTFRYCLEHQ